MSENSFLDTLEFLRKDCNEISEDVWKTINDIVVETCVPQMTVGTERPCDELDFKDYLLNIERKLKNVYLIFKQVQENFNTVEFRGSKRLNKNVAVALLLLIGEHSLYDKWTTETTVKTSSQLIIILCNLWNCKTSLELLIGFEDSIGLFTPALLALRPKLLKNTWKSYPAAVSCYQWMLFKVQSPHLSSHLNNVLPTALIILDDYVLENRIIGIKCLYHITENVTRTELGWNGVGEVIYKSLEVLLYQREAELIEPLVSCLITVLDKIEGGYTKDDVDYEWSRYDDVLAKLLEFAEMEMKLAHRMAYIKSLPLILEAAGLRMCRWSNRLMRVISHYLEVAGYSERQEAKHALLALHTFLSYCWPFVSHHSEDLLNILLRLLYDITEKKVNEEDEEDIRMIKECLMLVVKIAPEQSQILCKDIRTKARFNSKFAEIMDSVFE